MPSSKRGAGQSQIVNYWWLGTRAGYCASWVYNSASGRPLPPSVQLSLQDCDRRQQVVPPTPQVSGKDRICRVSDVLNSGALFLMGDVGFHHIDPPLKVGNQYFHFESGLVGVSLETG